MCVRIHVRGFATESQSVDDVTVVTVHGRVISRPKRRVLLVPVWNLQPCIRVVVGGISTVSGSRRIIPSTRAFYETICLRSLLLEFFASWKSGARRTLMGDF